TFLNKRKYQSDEKEAGKATFTMGLFGITEGAIPFAAQDPLRVIPSIMTGSMVGAVIAMLGNVGNRVAHGGPIVAVLGAVDNVLMFFIAVIVGAFVTAILVNILKKDVQPVTIQTADGLTVGEDELADLPEEDNEVKVKTEELEISKLTDITIFALNDINMAGATQNDVIDELVRHLVGLGAVASDEDFTQAIHIRQKESTT